MVAVQGRVRGLQGLVKVGTGGIRHKKRISREKIRGVHEPAIRRITRIGSVKRVDVLIYDETRTVLKIKGERLICNNSFDTSPEELDQSNISSDSINCQELFNKSVRDLCYTDLNQNNQRLTRGKEQLNEDNEHIITVHNKKNYTRRLDYTNFNECTKSSTIEKEQLNKNMQSFTIKKEQLIKSNEHIKNQDNNKNQSWDEFIINLQLNNMSFIIKQERLNPNGNVILKVLYCENLIQYKILSFLTSDEKKPLCCFNEQTQQHQKENEQNESFDFQPSDDRSKMNFSIQSNYSFINIYKPKGSEQENIRRSGDAQNEYDCIVELSHDVSNICNINKRKYKSLFNGEDEF